MFPWGAQGPPTGFQCRGSFSFILSSSCFSCHRLISLITSCFSYHVLHHLFVSPPSRPPGAPRAQGPYTGCFFVLQGPLGPRGERPGPRHRQATWHRNHCISCGKHICGSQFIVFASEIAHLPQNQCKVHLLIFFSDPLIIFWTFRPLFFFRTPPRGVHKK